ncbi:unnamed protein product [Rhodiola kirilowii]
MDGSSSGESDEYHNYHQQQQHQHLIHRPNFPFQLLEKKENSEQHTNSHITTKLSSNRLLC